MIEHEISVRELQACLSQLEPDDVLVTNDVRNLAIIRNGVYIGYICFLTNRIELMPNEARK